jgi:hypothetical protein
MRRHSIPLRAPAVAFCLLLHFSAASARQQPAAPEYRIKAAFLYNFTLYAEWPATAFESPEAPFVLAIAGRDPFGDELDAAVRGKTVKGRVIDIRRFERAADVTECHLLFITSDEMKSFGQILRRFQGAPLLTVAETENFTSAGGVIRLFVQENKIQFEVNTDAAARAKLKLSSKLLSLAKVVRDAGAPRDR